MAESLVTERVKVVMKILLTGSSQGSEKKEIHNVNFNIIMVRKSVNVRERESDVSGRWEFTR